VLRPSRAADGRHLKKRRGGRLDDVIVPYLNAMLKRNPDSVIGYTRRVAFEMVDLYFLPCFVKDVLKYVRPVISLDAAHLRSEDKGMLYIASVLSGNNDIYPIGFMIAAGNEDKETWIKMLRLLKQACPIISTPERGPFIFVSDRDKGLKPALKKVFPDNCEMSCAKHIEAKRTQKFGNSVEDMSWQWPRLILYNTTTNCSISCEHRSQRRLQIMYTPSLHVEYFGATHNGLIPT
jgi:hypothetical protein